MNHILLFVEYRNEMLTKGSLETVVKAKELACASRSELIVACDTQIAENDRKRVYSYGVDRIIVFRQKERNPYDLRALTDGFCELIGAYQPWMVLFCASDFENDMASRVGIKMGFPVMTNCLDLYVDDAVKLICPNDAGEYMITYQVNQLPVVVTFKQGTVKLPDMPPISFHKKTEYREVKEMSSTLFHKIKKQDHRDLDTPDEEVIIACGRGIGGEAGIHLVEKLAALLHAGIATSRANVDAGLMEKEYQVGLSGKTVKPRCYIACGISGAMHHVIGMNQSKWVMAINVDRNEPIFDMSDVGVVGDLSVILPRLIEEVEVRYGRKSE